VTTYEIELRKKEMEYEELRGIKNKLDKEISVLKYHMLLEKHGLSDGEIIEYGKEKIRVKITGVCNSGYWFKGDRIKKDGTVGQSMDLFREVKKITEATP
jgi:hypothetical protein